MAADAAHGSQLDVMYDLPPLCFHHVLHALDPASLARCAGVNKAWRAVVSEPKFWEPHCEAVWADKAYTPEELLRADKKLAYERSLVEATRQILTKEELCAFTWTFAFRDSGPGGWFPGQTFRRYFHADASVDTRPANEFWIEPRSWCFRWSGGQGPDRVQYVQVNEYPPMKVSRRPDWGWRIESLWVNMASDHQAGPNPGKEALAHKGPSSQPGLGVLAYYYLVHAAGGGGVITPDSDDEQDEDEAQ